MDKFIEEVLLTHEEIVAACERIGNEITKEYGDKKPILVGLLKGSVPFMAELIKHVHCDMEIEFMQASSYKGTESTGTVMVLKDITTSVKGRDLILVEDIVDTGYTIKEIMNLLKDRGANSIEIATLLDKPEGRIVEASLKYVGKLIPNKFVVGFGLDYDELYRNLDYIGVLKESVYKK
jgi:hypoxanthine phosphoribosyltransferase